MSHDYYSPGQWNVRCSLCNRKRKSGDVVKNWQGQWRCPEHNEPRHPQDYVRGIAVEKPPQWVQPGATDDFVEQCTPNGISAITGFAVAGCVRAGYISPMFDPNVTE